MPNKVIARKRAGRPSAEKSKESPSTEPNSSTPTTETPSKRLKISNTKSGDYFLGNPNPDFSSDEEEEKFGSKKYDCPRSSILKACCKPQTFNSFFKEKLETKLRPNHWELIAETPFCHFFDLPGKWVVSNAVLHLLLECWNPEKDAFIFKGNKLKFTSKEVGMALGLKHTGSLVSETDAKQKGNSEIHSKYFGNRKNISRQEIERILLELVDSEQNSRDFVKVLVLYLFAMVLFPLTQNKVDGYLLRYLDSFENLKNYSWAGAIHKQLEPQITSQSNWVCGRGEGQTYLKGCSLALQVWFYEHIDQAKLRVGLELIPRMFNWNLAEQHQRSGSFMKMLNRIPKGKVNEEALVPTDEEKIILKEGLYNSNLAQSIKSISQKAPPPLAIAISPAPLANLICNSSSQIAEDTIAQTGEVTIAVPSENLIEDLKQEVEIVENLKENEKEEKIVENLEKNESVKLRENIEAEDIDDFINGDVEKIEESHENSKEIVEKIQGDEIENIDDFIIGMVQNSSKIAKEPNEDLKENGANFISGDNEGTNENGEEKEKELKDFEMDTPV